MRREFYRQLEFLREDLGNMCELSGVAAQRATTALLEVDAESAGQVLTEVERLRLLNNAVERRAISILARQAPVAGDLRATVTAIQITADADRMGGLAAHAAKLCLRRHPRPVVPDELRDSFARMGEIAARLADVVVVAPVSDGVDLRIRWLARSAARRADAQRGHTRRRRTGPPDGAVGIPLERRVPRTAPHHAQHVEG